MAPRAFDPPPLLVKQYYCLNPRPAGVFGRTSPARGRADFAPPPLPNSRTLGRSEMGEAANECSR